MSIEDDDWTEIQRINGGMPLPDVTVKRWHTRKAVANSPVRSTIFLRGVPADYVKKIAGAGSGEHGKAGLVKVDLGGADANKLRIRAATAGDTNTFIANNLRNTVRIMIGVITAWPADDRGPETGHYEIQNGEGAVVITLGAGWARELPKAAITNHQIPSPISSTVTVTQQQRADRDAADRQNRVGQRTAAQDRLSAFEAGLKRPASVTAGIMGDPIPGRSALDQRAKK